MAAAAVARTVSLACAIAALGLGLPACAAERDLPLDSIKLPSGFSIALYARVPQARSMSAAPDLKTVFVGTLGRAVYAVSDEDGDFHGEKVVKVIEDLSNANSVVWDKGTLYVGERDKMVRYRAADVAGLQKAKGETVYGGIPDDAHHGQRYTALGPDGMLYVGVGAPCNICRIEGMKGSIVRIDPKSGHGGVFATGIRNTVGIDFHPKTGELYFTDNGADRMGDDSPPDELNHAPRAGMNFGFPFFGGGEDRTPDFKDEKAPENTVLPVVRFGAHVAALGLHFYRGNQLPQDMRNDAFVAQHGSWNRSKPDGYRVARVIFDAQDKPTGWEPFAEGWLQSNGEAWGRPVDVKELPDGSLLVSDDKAGAIYRISYRKP